MGKVTLELDVYNDLIESRRRLKAEVEELKKAHEEELEKLAKEGKVKFTRIKSNFHPFTGFRHTPEVEYVGFDEIKEEVRTAFKNQLFDEAFKKYLETKRLQYDELKVQIFELQKKKELLERQIKTLKKGSIWSRLFNFNKN